MEKCNALTGSVVKGLWLLISSQYQPG